MEEMKREILTRTWQRSSDALAADDGDEYVECLEAPAALVRPSARPAVHDVDHVQAVATTDSDGVFESTGQAIHVAFTIMAEPAQQDSMLRKSLVRLLDSMPSLSPRLTLWFEQLKGTPSDTVHFDGLSSYDVRAQCAMILLAVRTRLPAPEMWALQAMYCKTDFEGDGKQRRFAFSAEKATAIRGLSAWLVQTSAFGTIPAGAMDCMVAKFYARHTKTEISFRALASTFGGDYQVYFRAFRKVKTQLHPLAAMAYSRLQPYFEAQGIVRR